MEWEFPPWDHDTEGEAARVWDEQSGGWFVMLRDRNGSYTTVWKPDQAVWAQAISAAVAWAQAAAA